MSLINDLKEKYKNVKGDTTISRRDDKILAELIRRKFCYGTESCCCDKCDWWNENGILIAFGVMIALVLIFTQ